MPVAHPPPPQGFMALESPTSSGPSGRELGAAYAGAPWQSLGGAEPLGPPQRPARTAVAERAIPRKRTIFPTFFSPSLERAYQRELFATQVCGWRCAAGWLLGAAASKALPRWGRCCRPPAPKTEPQTQCLSQAQHDFRVAISAILMISSACALACGSRRRASTWLLTPGALRHKRTQWASPCSCSAAHTWELESSFAVSLRPRPSAAPPRSCRADGVAGGAV